MGEYLLILCVSITAQQKSSRRCYFRKAIYPVYNKSITISAFLYYMYNGWMFISGYYINAENNDSAGRNLSLK